MKNGDVGMLKHFSINYGNKGINYMQSESYVEMPVSTWCCIPISLPQEQASKTNIASVVRIQVIFYAELRMVWLILTYDWLSPMKLEKLGKALQLVYRKE